MKARKAGEGRGARPLVLALIATAAVAAALILALALRPPAAPQAGGPGDRPGGSPGLGRSAAPASIRVGSYNLAILGKTKLGRPGTLSAIASVLAGFDLCALQEVGSNDSSASRESCEAALAALAAAMDAAASAGAASAAAPDGAAQDGAAPDAGDGGGLFGWAGSGQFGFVYRADRLEIESWGPSDGGESFTYRPLRGRFKVRGAALDFAALTVHVSPGKAREEIPRLSRAMNETAAALGEPDVICLGDFNADGSYFDEGPEPGLPGFPAPDFICVIPDEADTTVGREELAYDRIVLSGELSGDYSGVWGILKPADLFDLSACEGPEGWAGTERALSDHYPVWAEFATGRDAD